MGTRERSPEATADEAVEAFRRVIAIDPKYAEAYNYIGYMYAERGENLAEALALIQQALALDPENGYFIDSLGWVYYQQGEYSDALRELTRGPERAKDDPEIFDHLGDVYAKTGRIDEAIAAWERALDTDKEGRVTYDDVNRVLSKSDVEGSGDELDDFFETLDDMEISVVSYRSSRRCPR